MDRKVGKRIQYLANQNRAYVNASLKNEGLTHGEANIIAEISYNEGLSQEDLRKKVRIDKSAITRVLKGLIEKGYVRREINLTDHRFSCLYLTDKANDKLEYIFNTFKQSSIWLLEGLDEKEIETIMSLLSKMCENVGKKVKQYE